MADLCRNPTILGIQEYGKRSEGKIRRLGKDGPRLLEEETDCRRRGGPRVIVNDPSLRVSKPVGEAQVRPGAVAGDPAADGGAGPEPARHSPREGSGPLPAGLPRWWT